MRLRWKMTAPYTYVECYEHRIVDGKVVAREVERHHLNRDRADNRPENLVSLSVHEHAQVHHHCDVLDDIVRLYGEGHSTVAVGRMVGRDNAVVYRHLVAQGVPIRNKVNRVTDAEREQIAELFREGRSWAEVGRITGRSSYSLAKVKNAL